MGVSVCVFLHKYPSAFKKESDLGIYIFSTFSSINSKGEYTKIFSWLKLIYSQSVVRMPLFSPLSSFFASFLSLYS